MSILDKRVTLIKELYAEEQKNPQKAVKFGDLPENYDAITREWLEAVILHKTPVQGAKLNSFNFGPRDDGTAERRRIHMEWNKQGKDADLPESVFCKATHDCTHRINMAYGGTEFEVHFYNTLRNMVDYEAPRAAFAQVDTRSYNSLVMLYDLQGKVNFCNKSTYATREMVEDQMRTLARLHARFYQSKDPEYLKCKIWAEGFEEYIEMCDVKTAATNGWDASKNVISPKFFKNAPKVWDATVLSYKRNALLPHGLVHSDVHLGNWYQTNEGKMGLQDYQCLGRGTPFRDIAYCLGTACTVEDRRAWEKDLIRLYLSEFEKAGGPKIDEKLAWQEIYIQSFTALAYWTLTITPTENMPQMQTVETCLVFIHRLVAQMEDWDVFNSGVLDIGLDVSMWK